MSEWIRCEDRMPPKNKMVMLNNGHIFVGWFDGVTFRQCVCCECPRIGVTHWKKLPDRPL